MRYKIEEGTMLYDLHLKMIGWVVGKHEWRTGPPMIDEDWDIEWSDGKKEYYDAGSLQIFVNDYLALKTSIIK